MNYIFNHHNPKIPSVRNSVYYYVAARFDDMTRCPGTYFTFIVEDTNTKDIVASCTLAVEKKFIRGCTSRGRIEDVVVDTAYRGKQLGKL